MPIIEVNHLTKEYRLGAMQGLKQTVLNTVARLSGKKVEERPLFKALNEVSFSVEPGEVVGIIGHNGAGKSTLLKMLAKISTPTHGTVRVSGRIAPLIEVGAGFVPDFTGRENVYLNGAILGMSRQEIDQKFDEIVDFAEMEEFIDTPVKRYSSGMQVKLAFAVATSVESEILIVDEVLAVGDLAFQRKCFDRMEDMIKQQGKTVLVVSHNIRQVERLCNRVILLGKGQILMDGSPAEVCNRFFEINDDKIKVTHSAHAHEMKTGDMDLMGVRFTDNNGNPVEHITSGHSATIEMTYRVNKRLGQVNFGIGFHTIDFIYLATNNWIDDFPPVDLDAGEMTVKLHIPCLPLLPRRYSLRIGVSVGEMMVPIYYAEGILQFHITSPNTSVSSAQEAGFFAIEGQWEISVGKPPINIASNFEGASGQPVVVPSNNTAEGVN
jgi:lipopolysaccharide transport system ATP-binding protein